MVVSIVTREGKKVCVNYSLIIDNLDLLLFELGCMSLEIIESMFERNLKLQLTYP